MSQTDSPARVQAKLTCSTHRHVTEYVCFNSSTTESISSLNLRPYTSVYPHGNLTAQSDIDELERQLAAYDAMDVARAGSCLDPEGAREYMSTATVVRDIE